MDLYCRKMLTNKNLKYAHSPSNDYVNIIAQNIHTFHTRKFPKNSHSRVITLQPNANNNLFTVVVCAKHVVNQPSKRTRASK